VVLDTRRRLEDDLAAAPPQRPARRPRPGAFLSWVAVVGSIEALLVGFATSRRLYSDSFYNLVAGREIVRHGFSRTDPWTFLGAHRRWVDQQWLAHVIYYGSDAIGGLRAVSIVSALSVGAGVGVLAAIMASRGTAPVRVAVWAALVGVIAEANAVVRAQSFAYVAFAIAIALLLGDWETPSRRRRALLVLTLLVWANLHGSVISFVPIVAAVWGWRAIWQWRIGDRATAARQLGWIALACLASMTTPFGQGIVGYYRSTLENATLHAHISEWHAASPANPLEILFFVVLVATIIVAVYAYRRRIRLSFPLAVAAVAYAGSGLSAARSEVWFGFVAALLISDILTRAAGDARPRALRVRIAAPLTGIALTALVACMSLGPALAYQGTSLAGVDLAARSAGASALICADNDAATALEWRHPELRGRVAFDARFELYSQAQLTGIFSLLGDRHPTAPAWLGRCDVLLVNLKGMQHADLARFVRGRAGYRVVYDRRNDGLVTVRSVGQPHG
jgi:hypothetical protein